MCRKAEPRHGPTGKRGALSGAGVRNRPPDATAAENEESMARTKMNQRSANRVAVPMGVTGGRTPPSKVTVMLLATSIISAVWAAAMLTPFGRVAYVYFFAYSEYYMGVISLVSLSITIMIGLVATDRLVLSIRQRVLLQSAHRTTGVIAVAALGLHVWTKVLEGHVRLIDTVVPFMSLGYNRIYVGLGTISGILMVIVMWTGLVRAWFVGRGRPWMWRSVHAISYLMWPIALLHGLSAGRPAPPWVIVCYVFCVLAVLIGLAVRLSVSLTRRKDFSSSAAASLKPVGSLVPTTTPTARRPVRSAGADDTGVRMLSDERPYDERPYDEGPYGGRRHRAEYAPEQIPVPRPRRYADDEPPRGRRSADAPSRGRHAEEESRYDQAPSRPRARPGEGYGDTPRRRSDGQRYDDAPRHRGTAQVRGDSGRHSRSEFVDLSDPNDPNCLPPDETPTLVDIAARRARRVAEQRDGVRTRGRSARRGWNHDDDGVADVEYWRQLRGEAQ